MNVELEKDRLYLQPETNEEGRSLLDDWDTVNNARDDLLLWWTYDGPESFPDPLTEDAKRILVISWGEE